MLRPFRESLKATCDATGSATIHLPSDRNLFSASYVAVTVSGNYVPSHVVQIAPALPLVFGIGLQAQLGPVVLLPTESADLVISGADANATVNAQQIGWRADTSAELPPTYAQFSSQVSTTAVASKLVQANLFGTALLVVSNPNLFAPGMRATLAGNDSNSNYHSELVTINRIVGNQLFLQSSPQHGYVVGSPLVVVPQALPAGAAAPPTQQAVFAGSLATTTTVLVAATPEFRTALYGFTVQVQTAGAGTMFLEGSDGVNVYCRFGTNIVNNLFFDFKGIMTPVGIGLRLRSDAASGTVQVSLGYSYM